MGSPSTHDGPTTDPPAVRVFVNAKPIDLPAGSTALDAVRAFDANLALAVVAGTRLITDSRGLATPSDVGAHAGSIFRVIANRGHSERGPESD